MILLLPRQASFSHPSPSHPTPQPAVSTFAASRGSSPSGRNAAAIAAQGFLRLGTYLAAKGEKAAGRKYFQAGLTIADTLFDEPYLSTDSKHQGLLLHSVYHRPNGWDHVAKGQKVPNGESSMWGDYHAMELALLIQRLSENKYYTFF